ncbi:MAG: peptide deformylase, partial [Bacteroidales bacterium]|nr:peptide deformylase [Bacteroidales bacterium]
MTGKAILGIFAAGLLCFTACWSSREIRIINDGEGCMRVMEVGNKLDSVILRGICGDISQSALRTRTFDRLCERMLATVQDPRYDGVGIAAPQVGINRRLVAVMRYDKDGNPFEIYPNIRIIAARGDSIPGPEGCLSVPGLRGTVLRSRDIDIRYTSLSSLKDTIENVTGFTAVIFQHETDHLYGILYTDKATDIREAEATTEE